MIWEKLLGPELPDEHAVLYEIFWDLFSGERMLFSEIEAYSRLYGIHFDEHDIRLLRAMDNAALKFINDEQQKKMEKAKGKTSSNKSGARKR